MQVGEQKTLQICLYIKGVCLCSGGRENRLLSPFKNQVLRGGRRCGWSVTAFGMRGPARATPRVPSAAGSSLWPWHSCMAMAKLGGTQSGRISRAEPGHQDTRTVISQGLGKCPTTWLAVTWAVKRGKNRMWAGVDGRGGIVGRCHFGPCHLANSCPAGAQASGAARCCASLAPYALTGPA